MKKLFIVLILLSQTFFSNGQYPTKTEFVGKQETNIVSTQLPFFVRGENMEIKFYNTSGTVTLDSGVKLKATPILNDANECIIIITIDTGELLKQGWKLPEQKNEYMSLNYDVGISNNTVYNTMEDIDGDAIVNKPGAVDGADYNAIYRHSWYKPAKERYDTIASILLLSDTCRSLDTYWEHGNIIRRWGFPITGFYTDEFSSGGTNTYPGLTEYKFGYLDQNKQPFNKCIVVWEEKH